ncbi:MAG: PD-(D/E)XK nuclease-like domain-containing protein [Verrucomicrobiota bacterium]
MIPDFSGYLRPPAAPKGYHQMDGAAYHAFPAVNSTLLKPPTQAEMLHGKMQPPEASDSKPALVLGTLTHAVCLEPWKFGADEWEKHFALCPTGALDTKAAAAERKLNPGKLLVTPDLLDLAVRIRHEAIETNPDAIRYLSSPDGMKEATGIVWDPDFQCPRKMRVDYLPRNGAAFGNYLLDIKTTRKPLHEFEREAWKLGYYTQAAWYLDTHELMTGHRPDMWVWLVVTNTEPFMSALYFMRNIPRGHVLYNEASKLRQARERLGLDDSPRIGRLPAFLAAARETEALRADGLELDQTTMRRVWTAYEQAGVQEIY